MEGGIWVLSIEFFSSPFSGSTLESRLNWKSVLFQLQISQAIIRPTFQMMWLSFNDKKHYLKEPQQNKKKNFILSFHPITDINYQTAFKGSTREKEVEKRNNISETWNWSQVLCQHFTCIIKSSQQPYKTGITIPFWSQQKELKIRFLKVIQI